MSAEALLDTNIISLYIRREPNVVKSTEQYLTEYGQLTFSIMTRYEILRGIESNRRND